MEKLEIASPEPCLENQHPLSTQQRYHCLDHTQVRLICTLKTFVTGFLTLR